MKSYGPLAGVTHHGALLIRARQGLCRMCSFFRDALRARNTQRQTIPLITRRHD
jgi:hypothetical protein